MRSYFLTLCLLAASCLGADWKTPTANEKKVIDTFIETVEKKHVSGTKVGRTLFAKAQCAFVDELDPDKQIFTQKESSDLQHVRGNAKIPIPLTESIYRVFLDSNKRRLAGVERLLSSPIDLETSESVPKGLKWAHHAHSTDELSKRWRLKLKHDLIEMVLAGISQKEAAQNLLDSYRREDAAARAMSREEFISRFLNSIACCLDPHSCYSAPVSQGDRQSKLENKYVGMGVVFQLKPEGFVVTEVTPDSPAAKAGLVTGDIVLAVENEAGERRFATRFNPDDTFAHLERKKGVPVFLLVKPTDGGPWRRMQVDQDTLTISERRVRNEDIVIDTASGKKNVRVIRVPSFYEEDGKFALDGEPSSSSAAIELLLQEEKPFDAVVLDVRGNGGGLYSEATQIANFFVGSKDLIKVKNGKGVETIKLSRKALFDRPVMMLVDKRSASSSEVLATALQANGRALIVGDVSTFGKGSVQGITRIDPTKKESLGEVAITESTYYSKDGEAIQGQGVKADIVHHTALSAVETEGEKFRKNALVTPSLTANPVTPNRISDSVIKRLRRAHEERMQSEVELVELTRLIKESAGKKESYTELSLQVAREKKARDTKLKSDLTRLGALIGKEPPPFGTDAYTKEATKILSDYLK